MKRPSRLIGLGCSTVLLLAAAGSVSATLPGPALEALGGLPAPSPAVTNQRCDGLNTICAGSTAISSVVCTTFSFLGVRGVQCTGASTVGGLGLSPAKLPGSFSFSGSGRCTSECSNSGSASGGGSWGGLLGASSAQQEKKIDHPTVKKGPSVFRTCVTYGVVTDADASARAIVAGLTVSSVSAPHSNHSPGASSLCNF